MNFVLSTPTSRLFIAEDVTDHSVWIQPQAGGSYINLEILFNFEYEPKTSIILDQKRVHVSVMQHLLQTKLVG